MTKKELLLIIHSLEKRMELLEERTIYLETSKYNSTTHTTIPTPTYTTYTTYTPEK